MIEVNKKDIIRIRRIENESGAWIEDPEQDLGYHYPAEQKDVDFVMSQPIDMDGRSEWTWFRLQDGTLILGVFPRGATYFGVEHANR